MDRTLRRNWNDGNSIRATTYVRHPEMTELSGWWITITAITHPSSRWYSHVCWLNRHGRWVRQVPVEDVHYIQNLRPLILLGMEMLIVLGASACIFQKLMHLVIKQWTWWQQVSSSSLSSLPSPSSSSSASSAASSSSYGAYDAYDSPWSLDIGTISFHNKNVFLLIGSNWGFSHFSLGLPFMPWCACEKSCRFRFLLHHILRWVDQSFPSFTMALWLCSNHQNNVWCPSDFQQNSWVFGAKITNSMRSRMRTPRGGWWKKSTGNPENPWYFHGKSMVSPCFSMFFPANFGMSWQIVQQVCYMIPSRGCVSDPASRRSSTRMLLWGWASASHLLIVGILTMYI